MTREQFLSVAKNNYENRFSYYNQSDSKFFPDIGRMNDEILLCTLENKSYLDQKVQAQMFKTFNIVNNDRYEKIMVSISGGSDSDIVIDMMNKVDTKGKCVYVWFNTGLEYQATKQHIKDLETYHSVEIHEFKAVKSIPQTCKEHGQPFLSKTISENIKRLQKHNFKWENKSFEELLLEYPNCKSALRWWCNAWNGKVDKKTGKERPSSFNIERVSFLKEFIMEFNPWFNISNDCCKYAKKDVAERAYKHFGCDLNVTGVIKAEGGQRATRYTSCFDEIKGDYRIIYYFSDKQKENYKTFWDLFYSDCYEVYGLKRTGCACCPYGKNFEYELEVAEKHEPKLHKAVNNIFKDAYEYTRMYLKFRDYMKKIKKLNENTKEYIDSDIKNLYIEESEKQQISMF